MSNDLTKCQVCGSVANRKVGMIQLCTEHLPYKKVDGMSQVDDNVYLK